jgi:hypothetical protein
MESLFLVVLIAALVSSVAQAEFNIKISQTNNCLRHFDSEVWLWYCGQAHNHKGGKKWKLLKHGGYYHIFDESFNKCIKDSQKKHLSWSTAIPMTQLNYGASIRKTDIQAIVTRLFPDPVTKMINQSRTIICVIMETLVWIPLPKSRYASMFNTATFSELTFYNKYLHGI